MGNPIIQAMQSMVLNGDFTQSFTQWVKGPVNPLALAIETEFYQGEMTKFLAAAEEASLHQEISVPWDLSADARYFLSFLFESRHGEAGRLRIEVVGSPDVATEIELPAGSRRDPQRDRERLADGLPLEFLPTEFNVELQLPLKRHDRIKVSVFSPKNPPGNYVDKICITRIRLDLHLVPADMEALAFDEQVLAQWDPSKTLHLCLGATSLSAHRLRFVARPDNPWSGTGASLVSDDNPFGAVIAEPAWGVDQSLDLPWALDCPIVGEDGPYLFTLNLLNRFHADPYPVRVSLGHHRLVFRETQQPAYYPVLEYAQSVQVGVQVASYYTGQSIAGQTVKWGLKGQAQTTSVVTDDNGWAYFDFQPVSAGDFQVQATVESPYYESGVTTEEIAVRALATDPLKEVMAVVEGAPTPWHERTGYPNRGSTYRLGVRVPAGSPLFGTEIAMHWQGDSAEQLGVQVEPELQRFVAVESANLHWDFACEDRLDGVFRLHLQCSKLKSPSASKPMSLARNLVRIGEVQEANKYPVVDENESVLLRVQVVHVVASGEGDPVSNAMVDWATPEGSVSTRSGAGGWASVLYRPTRAGDHVVTAKVRAHEDAVSEERPFDVKALATSPWKNQVTMTLDGLPLDLVELGIVCRRGVSHTLKVVPASGSSLLNQPVTLNWRGTAPAIGLSVSHIGTPRTLVAQGLEWTFSSQAGTSVSSLFALALSSPVLQAPRELFGRLLSADLADELSLSLDQVSAQVGDAFYPCLGARHRFRILPNPLGPLTGLNVMLDWRGTPPEALSATVEPPLTTPQSFSDGGVIWTLDFTASEKGGEFSLTLSLPQLAATAPASAMQLDHNKLRIDRYRETAVDPVVGQDAAWQWVRLESAFTGLPVEGASVEWVAQGKSTEMASGKDGWAGFGFTPTVAGEQVVEARVLSRFDGYREHRAMTVEGLATDPWRGVLLRFDGQETRLFGERTRFPRRKGEHRLEILAEEGSPLLDRHLTLGMTGTGPEELGVRFHGVGLGVPRRFSEIGLHYSFACDDIKDGSFALRLGAERLANLSPANAMSLGIGERVFDIIVPEQARQVLEWGQTLEARVTLVASTTRRPMVGHTITWHSPELGTVTSVTDFYGEAIIRFIPQTPGAVELTASVGDGEHARSVTLSYVIDQPREIESLSSPKPSGHLGELVSAVVHVVSALTGEPLPNVEVQWDYPDRTIAPTSTDAQGNARVQFRLSGNRRGLLEAVVTGGLAGWEVKQMVFELVPNANTWLQEFRPYVDGRATDWEDLKLNLLAGGECELTLDYRYSWLIGDKDAQIALQYKQGSEREDLTFDPPLGKLVMMAQGTTSLSWIISTEGASTGSCELEFVMPLLTELPHSPPVSVEVVNVAQDVDITFDAFTISLESGATAYPCHGANHTFTVKPKVGSQLRNRKVKWVWGGEPAENLGIVVAPPMNVERELTSGGLSWSLDCRNTARNGDFSLRLEIVDFENASAQIEVSLGHNLVTAERWLVEHEPHPGEPFPIRFHYIRATSSFLNVPVQGVRVDLNRGGSRYVYTDSKGEVSVREDMSFDGLWITNRYDGTNV
ncbi:hypothetical protein KVG96_03410 [Pseudomonas sp. COR58]|uniref:Big-1 domain-containing protein n=1 Tax=Pseudomonas ekonensis TaxID=2842353 RepID=A0ABS6P952_9PSED|nr:hypothetical protein [Pseudomonas ekonensis]MBV4456996.1 hypothetical protein [Pseudomonas ekonensis]